MTHPLTSLNVHTRTINSDDVERYDVKGVKHSYYFDT